jgi:superfamily II DNA or RNA helicase
MELNNKKTNIHEEALEKWIYQVKHGTVQLVTGTGKTFLFLKALYTMPKDMTKQHWFLAETTEREKDLNREIKKYNQIYNVDVYKDYDLKFHCYQSVYKWSGFKLGLVGCDEIHDQLTPEYFKFHLNNNYDACLGLSALINNTTSYTIKKDDQLHKLFGKDIINKFDMLNVMAPICYKYDMNQAQLDNTSRKLNIYIIKNKLDNNNKTILSGNMKNRFYQTEQEHYKYLNDVFIKVTNLERKDNEDIYDYENRKNLEIIKASNRRSSFLYSLQSKLTLSKELLSNITEKTIIFGNYLPMLYNLTTNVVSSANNDENNEKIRDDFNESKIKTIASFKKLKQGANLDGVDVCLIVSYYSSEVDLRQRMGRLRQNGDKEGSVFIIVTENTQEVVWFNTMMENIKEHNIILCDNVDNTIKEYIKNKK